MAAVFLLWCTINPTIAQKITKIGIVVPSITGSLLLFFLRPEGIDELVVPSVLVG